MSRATLMSTAGASDTFECVALPHWSAVRAFALSLAGDLASAEDLVQDTFLRAFKGFSGFTIGTDCRAWLFRICKNRFYDICRKRRRRPIHEDLELAQPMSLDLEYEVLREQKRLASGEKPVEDLLGRRVRAALAELPTGFREALLLCDLDGLSYQEIAADLQIPLGTVRSRIARARSRLRGLLTEYAREEGYLFEDLPAD
ncbi:MAG TPA: sigma-70 family RNA polymerase sigma factor [Planctomycetes bacterium]|nr:sigma-70 family RNA polymerase sigma factor [Planctomycetota bacterium]HIN80118.1 sigma-70 family RNA polymerase sigma factor [Planctomycetota bacterium]